MESLPNLKMDRHTYILL